MARTTINDLLAQARARLDRVDPMEAFAAASAGEAILVDIRAGDLVAGNGAIPGAVPAPRTVLEWRVDPDSGASNPQVADLDARLILFCSEGYASSLAAATLHDLGFARATDMIGGFDAWRNAGLPITRSLDRQMPRTQGAGQCSARTAPEDAGS